MAPGARPSTAAAAAAAANGIDGDFRQRGGYATMHPSQATISGTIDGNILLSDDRDGGAGAAAAAAAAAAMNPAKRNKKLYDKYTTEFSVVHRFRDPVADSFKRLLLLPKSDRDAAAAKDTAGIPRDYIGAHLSPSTAQFSLQAQAQGNTGAGVPPPPSSSGGSSTAAGSGMTPQSPLNSHRTSRSTSSKYGSQVRFRNAMAPNNSMQDDSNSTDYSSDDQGDSLVMQKKQQKSGSRGGPGNMAGGHRRLPLRGPPGMGGVIQEESFSNSGSGIMSGAGEQHGTDGGQSVERRPTDEEMLLRRIWEWRDMPAVGGTE